MIITARAALVWEGVLVGSVSGERVRVLGSRVVRRWRAEIMGMVVTTLGVWLALDKR